MKLLDVLGSFQSFYEVSRSLVYVLWSFQKLVNVL